MNSNCLGICILLFTITIRGRAVGKRHYRNISSIKESDTKEKHEKHNQNISEWETPDDEPKHQPEPGPSHLELTCPMYKHYTKTVCEQETMKLICLPGQSIKIIDVFYGRNTGEICNYEPQKTVTVHCHSPPRSMAEVEKRCNSRQVCSVRAHNDVFTDPCPYTLKYLRVSYMCLEEPLRTVSACDFHAVKITCPEGETIKVNSAQYGRYKTDVCNIKAIKVTTLTCEADLEKVTKIAADRCDGRQSCKVHIKEHLLDKGVDPCYAVFKHLDVNYQDPSSPKSSYFPASLSSYSESPPLLSVISSSTSPSMLSIAPV
ncbi:hypothetical protein GE061_017234 [Apolygus lucorum]|uniref:SUEL-type lectin domain-containing protein n=1 Tax=Apolygus lucorum TaxID=248454 RepID=A0A8S9XBR9_APOLU|nr:hypothetical protein GE061_017234 [Apolygus lucorum]